MSEGLSRLGFKTYKEYLASSKWFWVVNRLNASKTGRKNKCFCCGGHGHSWHHLNYLNLGNELHGRDVVRICFKCHEAVHRKANYLGIEEATEKVRSMFGNKSFIDKFYQEERKRALKNLQERQQKWINPAPMRRNKRNNNFRHGFLQQTKPFEVTQAVPPDHHSASQQYKRKWKLK